MNCENGHAVNPGTNFCPICGSSSFTGNADPVRSAEAIESAGPQTQQTHWWRNGAVLIAAAVILAAVIVAVVLGTKTTASPPSTTTIPIAQGPRLSYMQKATLKDFNKQESASGTSSNCAYDPTKWAPSYQFTCFIYNHAGSGLGTVVITSTSSAKAVEYTWNESFSLG